MRMLFVSDSYQNDLNGAVNNQKLVPYSRSLGDSSMRLFVDHSILFLKDFELFYFSPNFFLYIIHFIDFQRAHIFSCSLLSLGPP
jgi:hypothetical protein